MQLTTTNYKTDIEKTVRNPSYIKINLNISNNKANDDVVITDNNSLFFSDVDRIHSGDTVTKDYATFEKNRFILDGNTLLPPEESESTPLFQGYVSEDVSNDEGGLPEYPVVEIQFGEYYSFIGFTVLFDEFLGDYPTSMKIEVFKDEVSILSETVSPTGILYVYDSPIPECDKITLTLYTTAIPFRRVRINNLLFGLIKTFTEENLSDSTWHREVDLLTSKLPTNTFDFTAIDLDMEYNPDNPEGLWQYIERNQRVSVEYYYELDNGGLEIIKGAETRTTGELISDSDGGISMVTFKTSSRLSQLDDVYTEGEYTGTPKSLYVLAEEVFEFAGIPSDSYIIDEALNDIYTVIPLPVLPIKEVLQTIANAGRCVLYSNRSGVIILKRFEDIESNFKLDFNNSYKPPKSEKIPALKSIDTSYTTVTVNPTEETLVENDYDFSEDTEVIISFESATAVNSSVDGTLTIVGTPLYYASTVKVVLNGTGTLTVKGKKLIYNTTNVTLQVADDGFPCPVKNELLNNKTDTISYAEWVKSVLIFRNKYNIEERGYPELDPLDVIEIESLFTNTLDAIVLSNKLHFNGSLKAETKVLSRGEKV